MGYRYMAETAQFSERLIDTRLGNAQGLFL